MTASVSTDAPPHCLVEKRGHVLIVTLNRPQQACNALSLEMMATMREAWGSGRRRSRHPGRDPHRRPVVRSAGMDLKAMRDNAPGDTVDQGTWNPAEPARPAQGRRLTKPLIARRRGASAIAGGTEILQGTDIRVAGEAPDSVWPSTLRPVPARRQRPCDCPGRSQYTIAADLLLTGRHITAAEAKFTA